MAKLTRTQKFAELRESLANDKESSLATKDLSSYQNKLNSLTEQLSPFNSPESVEVKPIVEEEEETNPKYTWNDFEETTPIEELVNSFKTTEVDKHIEAIKNEAQIWNSIQEIHESPVNEIKVEEENTQKEEVAELEQEPTTFNDYSVFTPSSTIEEAYKQAEEKAKEEEKEEVEVETKQEEAQIVEEDNKQEEAQLVEEDTKQEEPFLGFYNPNKTKEEEKEEPIPTGKTVEEVQDIIFDDTQEKVEEEPAVTNDEFSFVDALDAAEEVVNEENKEEPVAEETSVVEETKPVVEQANVVEETKPEETTQETATFNDYSVFTPSSTIEEAYKQAEEKANEEVSVEEVKEDKKELSTDDLLKEIDSFDTLYAEAKVDEPATENETPVIEDVVMNHEIDHSNDVINSYINDTMDEVDSYNKMNGEQTIGQLTNHMVNEIRHREETAEQQEEFEEVSEENDEEFSNTVSMEISKIMDEIAANEEAEEVEQQKEEPVQEEPVKEEHPVLTKSLEEENDDTVVEIKNLNELEAEPVRDTVSSTIPFVVTTDDDDEIEEDEEEEGSNTILNIILIVLIIILVVVLGLIVFYILKTKGII